MFIIAYRVFSLKFIIITVDKVVTKIKVIADFNTFDETFFNYSNFYSS